jgi:hypothetical protein
MEEHERMLKKLMWSLGDIDEDLGEIDLHLKEGLWLPNGNGKMSKFPDLLVVFRPTEKYPEGRGLVAELKANGKSKKTAVTQMVSGKIYVETRMRIPVPYGKFVKYDEEAGFTHDTIYFPDRLHDCCGPPEFSSLKKYTVKRKGDVVRIYRRGSPPPSLEEPS